MSVIERAREAVANPPYGREPARRYKVKGVEYVDNPVYQPGNLASNAFVLGLLTAAEMMGERLVLSQRRNG